MKITDEIININSKEDLFKFLNKFTLNDLKERQLELLEARIVKVIPQSHINDEIRSILKSIENKREDLSPKMFKLKRRFQYIGFILAFSFLLYNLYAVIQCFFF